ncbi:sulfatase [Vallitalea guaymasensis]|uniref:sulfatase family protein n=1 Tax=Vallitalea guaymasensis TaxID=1185412 RepID=UPI002355D621|nr:sulfatase-like hydrolase/transferase [Vallitalea guaymasensis]
MKKHNIVFIMTDHQRADSIGMRQCNIEVTPNLNKLAKESLVFSRAYNTCPLCVPCRTAISTGKYPTKNGVVFNDWKGITARDNKPFPQILKENGYNVSHVGVDHIKVKPALKDRIKYDKWIDQTDYNRYIEELGISVKRDEKHSREVKELRADGDYINKRYSNTYVSKWEHDTTTFKDEYFTRESLDVIDNVEKDNPFALFINYWAPHPPLRVPEGYINKFNPDDIVLPDNVGKIAKNEPVNRRDGVPAQLAENVTEKEWRQVWSAHLALLNYVDDQVGKVIDRITEKGLLEDTIILFTSDHGDHLGQHSMYQKMEMYEQAVNVPLLIKIPNMEPRKIEGTMSNLDILPTLLDELYIEKPNDLDGTSNYEIIHNNGEIKDRKVFCQYSGNPELGCVRRAVITEKYKYIYDQMNEKELYDLESDPLEMNNIATEKENMELIKTLHDELVNWSKKKNDWVFD